MEGTGIGEHAVAEDVVTGATYNTQLLRSTIVSIVGAELKVLRPTQPF